VSLPSFGANSLQALRVADTQNRSAVQERPPKTVSNRSSLHAFENGHLQAFAFVRRLELACLRPRRRALLHFHSGLPLKNYSKLPVAP
jgi:hypothetical protein